MNNENINVNCNTLHIDYVECIINDVIDYYKCSEFYNNWIICNNKNKL